MKNSLRSKLKLVTFIYWLLLSYIIVALLWWYISLWQQNEVIYELASRQQGKEQQLRAKENFKTNKKKYIGEGITFFVFILVGAVFVHRSIRRQLKLQRQQQNFMMAVTHELKTPISIINLCIETLSKHEQLPVEKKNHLVRTALQENARLNFLTSNILLASQLEGGRSVYSSEILDLSNLIAQCLVDFSNRFPERVFKNDIQENLFIRGDALLVQMLVNNLLENATKYSPKKTPIFVNLYKSDNLCIMEVKDLGNGIPAHEREAIFTRFYRIGNEGTRQAKGTGLGLYLCKKIISGMGGSITVAGNTPNGSTFVVHLPLI